jgi:hypothetical protein
MASKDDAEKVKAKNIEESNEALSEQIDFASTLSDKMSFIVRQMKEKGSLDKASVDLTRKAVSLTRDMASEYESLKDVQKDIAKNEKAQNDIKKQILAFQKQGGDALKRELSLQKTLQDSLAKAEEKLAKMNSDKSLGRKIDEDLYKQAQETLSKKSEQLKVYEKGLSFEAQQINLLQQAGNVLEGNNEHLQEQLRRQENLMKSQSLFTAALSGTNNLLGKLGMGNLANKLGLDAATKKAKEMTYALTDGGKKGLNMFQKMRIAAVSFGTALKSSLGPLSLLSGGFGLLRGAIGLAQSAFNKFEEIGQKGLEAMKLSSERVTGLSRELGITVGLASKLSGQISSVGGSIGMTAEMAIKAGGAVYSALDGAEKATNKTLKSFMILSGYAGVSADALKSMRTMAKETGEDAGVLADRMAKTAASSIKSQKVNVSLRGVIEGVSKQSAVVRANFGGSVEGLTKAFVQAKKLGFELEKMEDIANNLLNFEESIAAEMEAEMLLGKELNLEKAREAALNNDMTTVMDEIAKNYGSLEDFQKMSRIQQEAAAKAMGMNKDQLAEVLSGTKANKAENTEMVQIMEQGTKALQSAASLTEQLQAMDEARNGAYGETGALYLRFKELMTEITIKLAPILNALMEGLFSIVMPIVEAFGKLVTDTKVVNSVTSGIKGTFQTIKETIGPIVQGIIDFLTNEKTIDVVSTSIKSAFQIIKDLINSVKESFSSVEGKAINVDKFVGFIKWGFAGISDFVKPIAKFIGKMVVRLIKIAQNLLPIIQGIFEKIKPIVYGIRDLIMGIVDNLTSFIEKLTSGNKEFTTMEKIVGGIAFTIGGILLTMKAIKLAQKGINKLTDYYKKVQGVIRGIKLFYLKLMRGETKLQKGLNKFTTKAKNILAAMNKLKNKMLDYLKKEGLAIAKNTAAMLRNFFKSMGSAIAKIFSSFAQIPFGVGIPLAVAAAAGLGALAYSYFNKGDDVLSPGSGGGGYGSRVLFGPEGAISLNNKDTVVAGTDLFQKGNDVVSPPTMPSSGGGGGGNEAILSEMRRVGDLLQQLLAKEGTVMLDGQKVGQALVLGTYKTQ